MAILSSSGPQATTRHAAQLDDPDRSAIIADVATRETVDRLRAVAPSIGVADGLLRTSSALQVVAIDPADYTRTGGPFTSTPELVEHFRSRPADGAGVLTGERLIGVALNDRGAWNEWITQHGVEVTEYQDLDTGRRVQQRHGMGWGGPCRVGWTPPVRQVVTGSAFGQRNLEQMTAELHRVDRGAGTPAWLAWRVAPDPAGRALTVRGKDIGHGVHVLPSGTPIPWHITVDSGWTLTATGHPANGRVDDTAPQWLLDRFGCKWRQG